MKKLPRKPMRREDEPGHIKEIWQPHWKCFCCHDSGIIVPHLAAMVIDGYSNSEDKLPRCSKSGCDSGSHWDAPALTDCVDYRISPALCQELDEIERQDWRETVRAKQVNLEGLIQQMSLRARSRTDLEQMEVQRRHEEICNADPERLREMAREYLGSEYLTNGAT